MSKLTLVEQSSVPTPGTDEASVYIDSATKTLSTHDDAGLVVNYGALATTTTKGLPLESANVPGPYLPILCWPWRALMFAP